MDKKEIVDYLAKKMFNKEFTLYGIHVMLKNKQIYSASDYNRFVKSNKISPEDAFVYIDSFNNSKYESYNCPVKYLFPLIDTASVYGIVGSYLVKLGFYDNSYYGVYPATGLKYYAVVRLFSDRLMIEVVDIDIVATNIGLGKIVADVLGKGILTQKEISYNQKHEITVKLGKQEILDEASIIIERYYKYGNVSLAKEVLVITNNYNRIFEPYRVVYDVTTRQQVLM